jgi:hypothetical protein
MDWTVWDVISGRVKLFFSSPKHSNWFWTHPASYSMDTKDSWGVKPLEREAADSPPSTAKAKV